MKDRLLQYMKNGYVVVIFFDIVAKVLMAVVTIFIIRVLSTEDYATYTIFQSISSLVLSIIGTGLTVAYVRFAAERISRGESNSLGLYNLCCILMAIVGLLALILINPLKQLYSAGATTVVLSVLYGIILSLNKMSQSYFQSEEVYKKSGLVNNFKNIALCIGVIGVYLIYKKMGDYQVMLLTLISALLAYVLSYFWILKSKRTKERDKVSFDIFKQLLQESGVLVVYFFLVALFDQISVIAMTKMSSDMVIASYGVASKYYMLMLSLLTSLGTVLRVKTSNKDMIDYPEKRKEFVKDWIRKVWLVAGLVCVLAIGLAGVVLPFLNGDSYPESIAAFRILMVGVFISYVFAPNVSVMMSSKKYWLLCLLAFASALVSVALCVLLIPYMGASGAAIATVASNAVLNVSCSLIILFGKQSN